MASGLRAYKDELVITDRNGQVIGDVGDALRSVSADWDVDRAGSKGQITVSARGGVLAPNMWVALYRTVIPEEGEIIRHQRSHFRLGRPGFRYTGAREIDTGTPVVEQSASGKDIVDVLASRVLPETFYTPVNGLVMQDVRVLLKMATCGVMGANLVPNGSFEDGATSWLNESSAWIVPQIETDPYWGPTDGVKALTYTFPAGHGFGSQGRYSRIIPVVPGQNRYYISGLSFSEGVRIDHAIHCSFYADPWAYISTNLLSGFANSPAGTWYRHFDVFDVPPGTAFIAFSVISERMADSTGYGWGHWDDIRLGTCTLMPLPDSRFDLPESTATATTRIQTTRGRNFAYDAINGDRLDAIGHHAIFTKQSGALTTRPLRGLEDSEPLRIYGPGSFELLVAPVEIPPGDTAYNHFVALKEDSEDATLSLYAEAVNDNPNDPYSVANTDVNTAPVINVPDAVDQDALQAVVNSAKDRNSTREEISFTILYDPDLTVYDVVEFVDPNHPAALGKWAVQSIADSGHQMTVRGRRVLRG